uniref:Uncharacterized protein n=1 Tax=Kalanchoe fedtschenkoi TaxID=63787 RepID=A0A7N0ZUJ5_KALFE
MDVLSVGIFAAMEDDGARRTSSRTRKVASKMTAALQSSDNRAQAAMARLDALENDNAGLETVEVIDDDEASLDDEDDLGYTQKKQLKVTKRKTRQAKALENTRKAPRTFLELLHEGCCRPSELYLTSPFLHSVWFYSQLHLCEVRDALLFVSLPKHS